MRRAVPLAGTTGANIDAVSVIPPSPALSAEMQKNSVSMLHTTAAFAARLRIIRLAVHRRSAFKIMPSVEETGGGWRRRRDSNPRDPFRGLLI
jgi:hypothetical protein